MKLGSIINIVEAEFPPEGAYDWDNCGLLSGRSDSEVNVVLVTLDITESIVEQAAQAGAGLILSHHPLMLAPINRITDETAEGRILMKAIENKIGIYAAHTSCDVAKNGINARLAQLFALSGAAPVEENGLGRIGNLPTEMSAEELAKLTVKTLHTPHVRIAGDTKKRVRRVAVGSGACSDIIPSALRMGADAIITGDTKYHAMLDAVQSGICVIDAGHYPTEIIVRDIFAELLKPHGIRVISAESSDVFKYI